VLGTATMHNIAKIQDCWRISVCTDRCGTCQ
jgi:hypothetical protein